MEYIQITAQERVFGKREFLQTQIDVISLIKRQKKIALLRKEEFLLKSAVRKKLLEINQDIKEIDKHLPKTKMPDSEKEKKEIPKRRNELELELEEIKHKLAALE